MEIMYPKSLGELCIEEYQDCMALIVNDYMLEPYFFDETIEEIRALRRWMWHEHPLPGFPVNEPTCEDALKFRHIVAKSRRHE